MFAGLLVLDELPTLRAGAWPAEVVLPTKIPPEISASTSKSLREMVSADRPSPAREVPAVKVPPEMLMFIASSIDWTASASPGLSPLLLPVNVPAVMFRSPPKLRMPVPP